MGSWLNYLKLQIEYRIGLSSDVVVFAVIAPVCGAIALVFLIVSAYIVVADRYGALSAALVGAGFFLIVAIVSIFVFAQLRARAKRRAQVALAARKGAVYWLDPKLAAAALQVSRVIAPRRLLPIVMLGSLAAGVGLRWYVHRRQLQQIDGRVLDRAV
jgi:hypothetical protein